MTDGKRNIIQQLLHEYDIQSAEDIQDALKDLLGGTIKEMMETEMDEHLGYEKSERSDTDDYRNGYKSKRINSSYGTMNIQVPQDRKSTFEPQVVKTPERYLRHRPEDHFHVCQGHDHKTDLWYAGGNLWLETSEGFISDVTDKIMPQIERLAEPGHSQRYIRFST